MTTWTDEELGALITQTLTAHESDVAAAIALRIAADAKPPRSRWPAVVAAAASVAIAIAGTTYVVTRSDDESSVTPTSANSYAGHIHAAKREAERILALAPIPEGATPLTGQPAGWRGTGLMPAFATTGIMREAWFSVAIPAAEVRAFLAGYTPEGLDRFGTIGFRTGRPNFAEYRSSTFSAGIGPGGAYTPPELVVEWTRVGDRTVIHAQVALAALKVRTRETFAPTKVTSIFIRRYQAQKYLPTVRLALPQERTRIDYLVASFNALVPMPDPLPVGLCPQGSKNTDRFTFVTADDIVTAQFVSGCPSYVRVFRNGRELEQRLDPSGFIGPMFLGGRHQP